MALSQAGYRVLALNPLLSKRRYTTENAIRDHKTDPVDAAGLCDIVRRDGHKLERFLYQHQPDRFALKRLLSVRKALRSGEATAKEPGIVVNMPFLTWPGGKR